MMKVLFFGPLRDIVGVAEDSRQVPLPVTVGQLFEHYAEHFPRLRELRRSIVIARNERFCDPSTELADGDEVAFLPPVSGGCGASTQEIVDSSGNFFALTRDPIDTRALVERTRQHIDGAVVTFEGVVRNNSKGRPARYLDFECYEPMAVELLAEMGADLARRHEISRFTMVHRLGRVEIGEASVVVVAAAPHRKAAFAAAIDGMDRLKRSVPIWKKEYYEDGSMWVEGDWDKALV
jgi:molybdopterin synthase catalytic subunit